MLLRLKWSNKTKNFYLTTKKQQDQVQYNVFIIVEIIQI